MPHLAVSWLPKNKKISWLLKKIKLPGRPGSPWHSEVSFSEQWFPASISSADMPKLAMFWSPLQQALLHCPSGEVSKASFLPPNTIYCPEFSKEKLDFWAGMGDGYCPMHPVCPGVPALQPLQLAVSCRHWLSMVFSKEHVHVSVIFY